MEELIFNHIVKQEVQLLDKLDSLETLADLIDEEFIEIGSSAVVYNKAEILQWLVGNDDSKRFGRDFQALQLAENVILLTYTSIIKDTPSSKEKLALRSSIWRLKDEKWRMVFHQGTPIAESKNEQ